MSTTSSETTAPFEAKVPLINGSILELPVSPQSPLFVVGPNGAGKSSLMLKLYIPNQSRATRVAAHRQMWMESNSIPFSPQEKISMGLNTRSWDSQPNARWSMINPSQRIGLLISRLIDADNALSRRIRIAVQANNQDEVKKLAAEVPPLEVVNELFAGAGLPIKMEIDQESAITARKNGGAPFSIAALSDGERAALLIAGDVLTADQNSLIILDEPERHLHVSIVVPLLSQLFAKRPDCAFVISTHELGLPLEASKSRVALIREFSNADGGERWDTDVLDAGVDVDNATKEAILGARRKILFIEGEPGSLDKSLYQIMFPNVSVVPRRTCFDVEHAVSSIRDTATIARVQAYGIVDQDQLSSQRREILEHGGVFALSVYSVEALYYNRLIIEGVANRQASILGGNGLTMADTAKEQMLTAIALDAERMAARMTEQAVKDQVSLGMLDWKKIKAGENVSITVDAQSYFAAEKQRLLTWLGAKNIDEIVKRYPIRETTALGKAASALQFKGRAQYEAAVRKLVLDKPEIRQELLNNFGNLPAAVA